MSKATTPQAPATVSATAAAVPATAATVSATPATVSATTPASHKLDAWAECGGVFLVEDIKRPQGNVGKFFLAQKDFMIERGISCRRHVCRRFGYHG
jgi:hypothetical protein